MAQTKILLADDHPLFLQGLVSLLTREKEFTIAGEVSNGNQVIEFLTCHPVDVCILDVNMPGCDGIEAVKIIRSTGFQTKLIMLTTYNDIELIRPLAKEGISGYVLKNSTGDELVSAIRQVIAGGMWFSPEVKQAMADDFVKQEKKKAEKEIVLTPREIDIVRLLAKELTNEKIAEQLFISYRTVETHRKNIMQKTGARNLAGLINFAHSNGLLR